MNIPKPMQRKQRRENLMFAVFYVVAAFLILRPLFIEVAGIVVARESMLAGNRAVSR